jgi:hypothetical protein
LASAQSKETAALREPASKQGKSRGVLRKNGNSLGLSISGNGASEIPDFAGSVVLAIIETTNIYMVHIVLGAWTKSIDARIAN